MRECFLIGYRKNRKIWCLGKSGRNFFIFFLLCIFPQCTTRAVAHVKRASVWEKNHLLWNENKKLYLPLMTIFEVTRVRVFLNDHDDANHWGLHWRCNRLVGKLGDSLQSWFLWFDLKFNLARSDLKFVGVRVDHHNWLNKQCQKIYRVSLTKWLAIQFIFSVYHAPPKKLFSQKSFWKIT